MTFAHFRNLVTFLFLLASAAATAQTHTTYSHDFSGSKPLLGYKLVNSDLLMPSDTSWKTLADSAFVVRDMGSSQGRAAIGTSAYTKPLAADDWLITPSIRLGKASKIKVTFASLSAGKPDHLEVYISTSEPTVAGCLFNGKTAEFTTNGTTSFQVGTVDLAANSFVNQPVYIGLHLNTLEGGLFAIKQIEVTEDSTLFASLTFTVNMSAYINAGKFNPKTDTVDVAGNFNQWDGTRNILSFLTPGDSSVYSITIPGFLPGDHLEFKFRINSSWSDTSVEFPYNLPNRTWDVEYDRYIYSCNYNDRTSLIFGRPDNALLMQTLVYPNPANDQVVISAPEAVNRFQLIDMAGHQAAPGLLNKHHLLDVSRYSAGTYLLVFYKGNELIGSKKLIIRR